MKNIHIGVWGYHHISSSYFIILHILLIKDMVSKCHESGWVRRERSSLQYANSYTDMYSLRGRKSWGSLSVLGLRCMVRHATAVINGEHRKWFVTSSNGSYSFVFLFFLEYVHYLWRWYMILLLLVGVSTFDFTTRWWIIVWLFL